MTVKTFGVAILVVLAVVLFDWIYGQVSIDSCLDRGGSWDYDWEICLVSAEL